ncbi:MAG: AzlD domain-containing protein [Selenomonadaceae bacterium]|nr:AzlD domain-containing protein [Selenomonadaceae bacterium]
MNHDIGVYIFLMGLVTVLIRILPLTLIRGEIKHPFIRSFLHYVPYVTLAVMTVPGIFYATRSVASGVAAFLAASVLAFFGGSLFKVAAAACAVVFITEAILL